MTRSRSWGTRIRNRRRIMADPTTSPALLLHLRTLERLRAHRAYTARDYVPPEDLTAGDRAVAVRVGGRVVTAWHTPATRDDEVVDLARLWR